MAYPNGRPAIHPNCFICYDANTLTATWLWTVLFLSLLVRARWTRELGLIEAVEVVTAPNFDLSGQSGVYRFSYMGLLLHNLQTTEHRTINLARKATVKCVKVLKLVAATNRFRGLVLILLAKWPERFLTDLYNSEAFVISDFDLGLGVSGRGVSASH